MTPVEQVSFALTVGVAAGAGFYLLQVAFCQLSAVCADLLRRRRP